MLTGRDIANGAGTLKSGAVHPARNQRQEYIIVTDTGIRTRPRWTNKHNVDPTIAAAITHGEFYLTPSSDFTVTELIKPPQINWLSMVHAHELQEDVSDRLWALLGSAIHEIMRRGADKHALGNIAEERLEAQFQPDALYSTTYTVSGKSDIYYEHIPDGATWNEASEEWEPWFKGGVENAKPGLADFKSTSVWAYVYKDKDEWEIQLNLYAYLWRLAGYPVERLVTLAIMRDHLGRKGAESEAKNGRGEYDAYPASPFGRIEVPMWPIDRVEEEFKRRIAVAVEARSGRPRPCSDEDRWKKADKWAVRRYAKSGKLQARAAAVCDTDKEAGELLVRQIGTYIKTEERKVDGRNRPVIVGDKGAGFLDERKGEDGIRCAGYCPVLEWCEQGKEIVNGR